MSTIEGVYMGKDVQMVVTDQITGDNGAYTLQEVTLTPKRETKGVDACGSDEIQFWGKGLKTFEGTLKEPLRYGAEGLAQLNRMAAFSDTEYTVDLKWTDEDGGVLQIQLGGVIFDDPSISAPKNDVQTLTQKFKAKTAVPSYQSPD